MQNILLSAAALASLAAIAQAPLEAKDLPKSGPWIGLTAGYDRLTADDAGNKTSKGGIVYGLAMGYDFDLGGITVGPEIEIANSTMTTRLGNVLVTGDKFEMKTGRDLYAGMRIGIPVAEGLTLFAKGGYSNLRLRATYTSGTTVTRDAANDGGFRLGGGAELDLDGSFLRSEYRYSDYGAFNSGVEARRHQLVMTAGYRF